jgi:Xaa-Pro aminopeptidase
MTRSDRIAAALPTREVDLLLVAEPVNLRYATGYTGSNGLALIGADTRIFLTDFRYVEQAAAQVADFDRPGAERDLLESLPAHVPADGGGLRLGFDDAHTSVRTHRRLGELLGARAELVPAGGVVEELRAVKDAGELDRIRAAARIADDALRGVLDRGLAGRTERAVALELEHEMRLAGAQALAFPSIVAAADHGSRPHAEPRDVPIPDRVLVTVDWGARVDGYCSDCTRTFAVGELDEEARESYELVRRAQARALEAVAPGRGARELDAVARDLIDAAGHGEHFGHPLGHGVGLEVHEEPRLSRKSEATLRPGNVVTVEPGVYVPGRFGVRIEDLVVVTEGGREVLSSLPKDLVEVR